MYKSRKKYSKSFKENAVRLLLESDLSPTEIARDLGINRRMMYRWKKEILSESNQGLGGAKGSENERELKRLKKENAELKMEREILKKALSIFSKHPK